MQLYSEKECKLREKYNNILTNTFKIITDNVQ